MNTTSMELPVAPRAPVAAPHPTHMFKLLLKREFWEHKGGFFWAPIVAGAISLLLTLMAIVVFEIVANRAHEGTTINVDGGSFQINGLDLNMLTQKMSGEELIHLSGGIDVASFLASFWPLIVLAFVVFFYCLGSLYDDRKDRSVLFWKSLPLSDSATVLSKVVSATVVAPILAIAVGIISMVGFLALLSLLAMFHGGNPLTLVWGPGNPLTVAGKLIASIPIYAMWALPTVGWLMLCSSWAKSKPFLWAIMIPVFAGIFVTWFDLMQLFEMETVWFWKNIVARSLLSVAPGSWIDVAHIGNTNFDGPAAVHQVINVQTMYSVFLTPQLWIGAAAGAAMIFGAIRLRRWRDEG